MELAGGAGAIERSKMTPELEREFRQGLHESIQAGYTVLEKGGTSLDAVKASVNVMEDSSLFNAGKRWSTFFPSFQFDGLLRFRRLRVVIIAVLLSTPVDNQTDDLRLDGKNGNISPGFISRITTSRPSSEVRKSWMVPCASRYMALPSSPSLKSISRRLSTLGMQIPASCSLLAVESWLNEDDDSMIRYASTALPM